MIIIQGYLYRERFHTGVGCTLALRSIVVGHDLVCIVCGAVTGGVAGEPISRLAKSNAVVVFPSAMEGREVRGTRSVHPIAALLTLGWRFGETTRWLGRADTWGRRGAVG